MKVNMFDAETDACNTNNAETSVTNRSESFYYEQRSRLSQMHGVQ